jgi:creatinine amidohydrolase
MRTRIFNKMTAQEVEDYLARGGDTIFLAQGVVEVHGECPIDCETIVPEAMAMLLAEEADGLAMINLPYFYPGGTVIGNSTVHITILEGIEYLMKICHSLKDQGFRRIYIINGHGPSGLTANAVTREFFDETRLHICNLSMVAIMAKVGQKLGKNMNAMGGLDTMTYGAYKLLGQLDYIPIKPEATEEHGERIPTEPALKNFMDLYRDFAGWGATAQIYSDPRQHGGGRVFRNREELETVADQGIAQLKELVQGIGIREINDALAEYHEYVQEVCEKYPRVKPQR